MKWLFAFTLSFQLATGPIWAQQLSVVEPAQEEVEFQVKEVKDYIEEGSTASQKKFPIYVRSARFGDGKTLKVAGANINFTDFLDLVRELKVNPERTHKVSISIPVEKMSPQISTAVEQLALDRPDLKIDLIPELDIAKMVQEKALTIRDIDPTGGAMKALAKMLGIEKRYHAPLFKFIRNQENTKLNTEVLKKVYAECEKCSLNNEVKRQKASRFDGLYLSLAGVYTGFRWSGKWVTGDMSALGSIGATMISWLYAYAFSYHRDDTRWQERMSNKVSSYLFAKGYTELAPKVDGVSRWGSQMLTSLVTTAIMRGVVLWGEAKYPGFGLFALDVFFNAVLFHYVGWGISTRLGKWENNPETSPMTQREIRFVQQFIKVIKIFAFWEVNQGDTILEVVKGEANPEKLLVLKWLGVWGTFGALFYFLNENWVAKKIRNSNRVMPQIRKWEERFNSGLKRIDPALSWITKLENFVVKYAKTTRVVLRHQKKASRQTVKKVISTSKSSYNALMCRRVLGRL